MNATFIRAHCLYHIYWEVPKVDIKAVRETMQLCSQEALVLLQFRIMKHQTTNPEKPALTNLIDKVTVLVHKPITY